MSYESDLTYLLEMGFSQEKCQRALKVNNNKLQEALDWLLVHGMEPDTSEAAMIVDCTPTPSLKLQNEENVEKSGSGETENAAAAASSSAELTANSLKCDDCGALLKDEDFATLHAHKTGHVNFSQSTESIKPKTKEEIEEQKKRLEEKLKVLRAEKLKKEQEDQIEREKIRRKEGRQIGEIKQQHQENEMKRLAEERRREKLADIEYKRKLKEQIAADRESMKREKEAAAAGNGSAAKQEKPVPPPQLVVNEKREYDECRIQIRLTDGKMIQQTFKAKEPLAAVRIWIEMNRSDGAGQFNIMQTFPRKVYSDEDMTRSLLDLGLVPASSLVISKA